MTSLFFSYSHKDEDLRDQLEVHLAMLKREGLIDAWHDRKILAGDQFDRNIDAQLEEAAVILLLVSSDFLASEYCYDIEMQRAMQRQDENSTRVIPVILRPCDWHNAPFGRLQAAPKDAKPITKWTDRDDAFVDVVRQIRAALPKTRLSPSPQPVSVPSAAAFVRPDTAGPRSSNMRVRKVSVTPTRMLLWTMRSTIWRDSLKTRRKSLARGIEESKHASKRSMHIISLP